MGDLELMRPGIIDMLGVFFLKVPITKVLFFSGEKQGAGLKRHIHHFNCKLSCPLGFLQSFQASSYEFVTESADQGSQAYW